MRTLTRYAALTVLAACTAPALAADPAMDDAARMQYALGYQLGKDLAGVELRAQDLQRGLEDGRSGAKAKLSDEEMNSALMALQERVNAARTKAQAAEAEKTLAAGKAYLEANAKKPGVTTTASGLQYRVITAGSGAKPQASDTVTVHYKGTLVDGTEFDSSYKRGQPATFPVGGVIPGWTEALQLMPVGSKYKLWIPSSLGYGDRGTPGPIGPNATLVFEVELIEIVKQ